MSEGAASAAPAEDALDMELTLDIEALSLNEKDLQQFPGQMSPISPTKHECLFSAPEVSMTMSLTTAPLYSLTFWTRVISKCA